MNFHIKLIIKNNLEIIDPIAYRQHDIIGTLSDHFMSEPHNIQPSIKSSSYSTCTALDIYPNIHTSVPQENKDRMKKKVNKLQAILGESLDQETRKKLYGMKQITDETTTASPATFQDEDASEKRPFQDLKKMLGKFVNNASQDVEVFVTGASKEALIAASSTDQKVTIALSGSTEFDHQSATSPSSGPLEVQSLSGEEKKNIQKRASKLEQLLGQQPPTAALMTKSNIELTKLSNDKIDEEDESEEESQTTDLDSGSRINLTSNRKKLNKLANMLGEKISPETIATERESSKQIAKDQLESSQIRNNKKLEKLLGHSSNDLKDTSALKEAKSAGNLFFNRPLADAKSTSENNLAKAGSKERIKPK